MNISANPFTVTALNQNKAKQTFKSDCPDGWVYLEPDENGNRRCVRRDSDAYSRERDNDIEESKKCEPD
jgi:hypothetical protein